MKTRPPLPRTAPEPPPVDGARWVPLTKGKFALVDAADFPDVSRFNWCETHGYAARYDSATRRNLHMEHHLLGHRKLDHEDRDRLNNRRLNLRPCSGSQNVANVAKVTRPTSSRFKGVVWTEGRWRAYVRVDLRRRWLGCFEREEDAARARDSAALEAWGEFAVLNFPRAS